MDGQYRPPIESQPPGVKWSHVRWRQLHSWCCRRGDAVCTTIQGVKRKELKSSYKNTEENNVREKYIRLVTIW